MAEKLTNYEHLTVPSANRALKKDVYASLEALQKDAESRKNERRHAELYRKLFAKKDKIAEDERV